MSALRWTTATLACLLFGTLLLPTAGGAAGPFGERCEYVEAGPPGPKGNRLVVVGDGDWLNRHGDRIVVHDGFVHCTGGQATVHNIDRIVLKGEESFVLGERGGGFSPGATRERSGSEIEITVVGDGLDVLGRERADTIRVKTLDGDAVALNLNANEDGAAPDFDLILQGEEKGELPKVLRIEGRGGGDLIDARRLTGMGDNAYLRSRIRLEGGTGDDTILGSPGDEYRLQDGPGNDLVRAGGATTKSNSAPDKTPSTAATGTTGSSTGRHWKPVGGIGTLRIGSLRAPERI